MKSKLVIKIIQTETETGASLLEKKGMVYSFLNPVSYLDALKHKELFGQMDGLFACCCYQAVLWYKGDTEES